MLLLSNFKTYTLHLITQTITNGGHSIYLSTHASQPLALLVQTLAFALNIFRQPSQCESHTARGRVIRKSAVKG